MPLDRSAQCFGLNACIGKRRTRQECKKLVSAEPPGNARRKQVLLEEPRQLAEHDIASVMSAGVIDPLEAVEVDQQQRERDGI